MILGDAVLMVSVDTRADEFLPSLSGVWTKSQSLVARKDKEGIES
jgi:hypothetical protein